MLFHQDQNITIIEQVNQDAIKRDVKTNSVTLERENETFVYENVLSVSYHENIHWDFGY